MTFDFLFRRERNILRVEQPSKKALGGTAGLPLAIKALEAAPTNLWQMFKSFVGGYTAANKRALDALAETIECPIERHYHERLAKPDKQNFTPLGKLMQLAVAGRNRDAAVFSDAGGFNVSSCCTHDRRSSFLTILARKITRRLRARKGLWLFADKLPPNRA